MDNHGDNNIAVLVPRTHVHVSRFASVLSRHQSIFNRFVSFEDNNLKSKTSERKRRMRLLHQTLTASVADRIYTGTDRRIEFQYAMHLSTRMNRDVRAVYVDEGMATYLGHKSADRIQHRYIDPLIKKIVYGYWWKNPVTIGSSDWISEIVVAYPSLVHSSLRSKPASSIERKHFQRTEFRELCSLLLQQNYARQTAQSIPQYEKIGAMIVLTHESFYSDPKSHLHSLVECCRTRFKDNEIAIKAHPRSSMSDAYQTTYPQLQHIPNQLGTEILVPMLPRDCVIIGDISSTLFTTRWLNPLLRLVAIELPSMPAAGLDQSLLGLLKNLHIPHISIDSLAALLADWIVSNSQRGDEQRDRCG